MSVKEQCTYNVLIAIKPLLYLPLDGQTCPEVGWNQDFFLLSETERHETRQHMAVKVWWRDLQS